MTTESMKWQATKVTLKLYKRQTQACTKKESCYADKMEFPVTLTHSYCFTKPNPVCDKVYTIWHENIKELIEYGSVSDKISFIIANNTSVQAVVQ